MNKNSYKTMSNYWSCTKHKENYFVSYSVRGPIVVPSMGLESDLPTKNPIMGTVSEPSPLNNRWLYSRPWPKSSIF